MPAVSILMSIYNGEKTLERSLKSIFEQDFTDFEVLCVNDCSTDGTTNILASWQARFPEQLIIIENQSNLGLTRSLNLALQRASSQYIARIDADDFWEPTKLTKQVQFLHQHPECGIVGSNHINIYDHNPNPKKVYLPETHAAIARYLFRRNPFAHSCILARTELLQKAGGYNENIRYGQDYDLWLRCFPHTQFYNIQEFLCTRSIDDGISIAKQNEQMRQSIRTRIKYIRLYNYSWKNYLYLLEPLAVILTPNFIKNIKRRYL